MSSLRLLDQVRDRLRVKHYSMRTADIYLQWIRRFIFFHGKKHPREMGGPQVEAFRSHLATVGRVAASTQNQALSALLFLYRTSATLPKVTAKSICLLRWRASTRKPGAAGSGSTFSRRVFPLLRRSPYDAALT